MFLNLILSLVTFAATPTLQVSFDLSSNKVQFEEKNLALKQGEVTTLTKKVDDEIFFVNITPKQGSSTNQFSFECDFGKIDALGRREILSRPQITALANHEAWIETRDIDKKSGKILNQIKVKITPTITAAKN